MSMFKCSRTKTSFIKPKHRQFLAFTNPVSPSEIGLEGLLFCCAVTITWNVRKASTDNLAGHTNSRSKIPKSRSRNQDPETKIPKSRSRNQDPEIKIQKSRSRIKIPKSKIQKSRSRNQDPEIKIQKSN